MDFARSRNIAIARYAIRAWPRTDPEMSSKERWVKFPLSNEAKRAKARAIQCFRSQIRPGSSEPIGPPQVFGRLERPYEAFVL